MKYIESFCPIRDILSKIGDKWSLLVLLTLESNDVVRFSELSRAIPDISQKMLTTTLRNLENMQLINRKIYAQVPPRVDYSITDVGESLMPHVHSIIDWALEHKDICKA